jgi:hypothetical protein
MVMSTSGISADTNADGIVVNIVPKEGGNTFRTIISGMYANSAMEATNLSQDLIDRGLQTSNKTIKLFDEAISVGGPIKRDHLWFFVAPRTWGVARTQAGTYWNKTQNEYLSAPGAQYKVVRWTPWVDRPEDRMSGRLEWYDSILGRVTWQATSKNKFNFTFDEQRACNCGSVSAAQSHEFYLSSYRFEPNRLFQATWSSPVTNKILLEAGYAATISQWNMFYQPGVTPDIISISDVGTGQSYGAATVYLGFPNSRDRYTMRGSMSYVTGSHNFKTGFQNELPATVTNYQANGNMNYTFRNGAPISITQRATPYTATSKTRYDLGLYAQDQWTINERLTLNMGLRIDMFNGYTPDQVAGVPGVSEGFPGGLQTNEWLGERAFAGVNDIPNWKDWSPRLGISYDLFGNGRTAVKAQLGKYVSKLGTDLTEGLNPIATAVTVASRSWNDVLYPVGDPRRGNFVPDCDLGNFAINGECGAISNSNFGKNNPNATQWDPAVLEGWSKRDSNWDFSTEIQHELRPGFGLTGGYYWNNGGYTRQTNSRRRVTDNVLVNPADYDPFCIMAPVNAGLPGGGGYEVCGLYNIKPEKFGQVSNLVTAREPFGDFESRNDFFNVAVDARLAHGIRLGGGADTGRSVAGNCFVVDSPQELLNCRVVTPFSAQTQFKAHGVFPLPAGFITSFAWQNLAGPTYNATYTATAAEIIGLGRPLSGGATTVQGIPLVAPQTLFEDRVTRLDLRLSKNFQVERFRIQLNLDAYNALNANSVRAVNSAYGAAWTRPQQILDPRILQVGGTIQF